MGSRQNASFPMTVIAAIMTQEMNEVSEELKKGTDVWEIIRRLIKETKNVRF